MSDLGTRFTDARHAALVKQFNRVYRQAQQEIIEKLNEHTKRMNAKAKIKLAQLAAGTLSQQDFDDWLNGQVYIGKLWRDKVTSVTSTLMQANQQANAMIENEKRAVFGENASFQAYQLEHDADLDLSFTVYDSATVTRLLNEEPELLPRKKVNGKKDQAWNRRAIANAVTQGIIQGESVDEVAKRIAKQTCSKNKAAMTRYARTALTGAQNAGRMEVLHEAQHMGIKVKKRWLAALDSRTREAHQHLDSQVQEVDKPFHSDLGDIMYPGDFRAKPGNVWNCRCTLVYEYDEYPTQYSERRAYAEYIDDDGEYHRESYTLGNISYNDWKLIKGRDTQQALEAHRQGSSYQQWRETNRKKTTFIQTSQKLMNGVQSKAAKSAFTPAQTIEEAEAFARTFCDEKRFGAVGVSYDGLTLDSANDVNKTISEFFNEYAVEKFGGVVAPAGNTKLGKLISDAVAGYSPIRHSILLNRKSLKSVKAAADHFQKQREMVTAYLKNPAAYYVKSASAKKVLDAAATSGRATVPMTVEEAIWHELGHSLEKGLKKLPNYDSLRAKHAEWGAKISGYASTEFGEYVAESFCAMKKGEKIESELEAAFKALRRK